MEKSNSLSGLGTRILCVDDEPNILEAFKRGLRGKFELDITTSGDKALELVTSGQNFGVVVSDMRMPGLDGIAFLQKIKEVSPLTVRIMLTGNADQATAVKAINEGCIFRFLSKPCSSEDMEKILNAAVSQYRLQTAERDLLQNTLSGSIKVLTDILSINDAQTFSRAAESRPLIRKICSALKLDNAWEIELAAMLSGLGWALVPHSLRDKIRRSEPLSSEELKLVHEIPETSRNLINNIPRLQGVAQLVYLSGQNYDGSGAKTNSPKEDALPIGARIVSLVLATNDQLAKGLTLSAAVEAMRAEKGRFDPKLLELLVDVGTDKVKIESVVEQYEIKAKDLCVGQRLMADIFAMDGRLLLGKGVLLSEILLKRLLGYASLQGLKEPLLVDCRLPTVGRD